MQRTLLLRIGPPFDSSLNYALSVYSAQLLSFDNMIITVSFISDKLIMCCERVIFVIGR